MSTERKAEVEMQSATFSTCGTHRFCLARRVGNGADLVWCMLNPSTADAFVDDPTIRKVKGFTQRFGYGRAVVVNLFSWRATQPRDCLVNLADASPDENLRIIKTVAWQQDVVCAWGAHPWAQEQADRALDTLRFVDARLFHLGLSKAGMPRHPLMLPYSAKLTHFDGAHHAPWLAGGVK